MTHPILQGIRSLRKSLVRRTWLAGGLRVFAAVAAVAGLLGAIDYSFRVDDAGLRLIMTGLLAIVLMAAVWRWLVRPLARIPSDVALARQMIEEDPRLGEELPTAIEFLNQAEDDPLAGSAVLRRAVVIRAQTRLEGLDWARFVDRKPQRRAVAFALVPVLLIAAIALWRPQLVGVGIARLASPLGATDWPRSHHLQFVKAPERLPSAESFEVELVDRGERLPDEVWIHYRFLRDGQPVIQREPMQRYGDMMVARREIVTQPFEYRAVGGDDDRMDWRRLDVVEPPRLRGLELTLHPPAYTGLPPMAGDQHVRALPGTQIEVSAQASHPLVGARIISEHGQVVEAPIGQDKRIIHIPPGAWTIAETAHWSFELEDTQGLVGGEEDRISIHASPDPPPSVTLARPANDQYVTTEAVLPVTVSVKDNLAVRDISLTYLRSDQSDKDRQRVDLHRGPAEPPSRQSTSLALLEADRRDVEYTWDLSSLGLSPGAFLSVHAEATDYQGEVGQTPLPRNIHIVSLAELEARLAEQQDILLSELERALQLQRQARGEVRGVEIQLAELGNLAQREIDTLQAVEINQRHITDLLGSSESGIAGRIQALRGDLVANRVENPDIQRRLDELENAIDRLLSDHLPVIGRELTSALKTAATDPAAERLGPSLTAAADHQDAVIASLAALLGDFSRWSDYRRFARDVAQLRADQQRLAQSTREDLGLDQVHSDLGQLGPQARADRERVSRGQLELARRLESLQQQMEKTAAELDEEDPLASTTLSDAARAARQHGIDRRMRQAAEHVGQNRVGRALDAQSQIDEALREVLGILRNTRESELRRLVSKLRQAEQELQSLRNELAGLQDKAAAAADPSSQEQARRELERLTREQNDLRQKIEQMSRRLMRLTAAEAGQSTARAAGRLGQDAQESSVADRLRAAERDLEQAQAQLAESRRQAEADLAEQQVAGMNTMLQGLADREQNVVDDAHRLEEQRVQNGEWTFGQIQSLVSLAEEQKLLKDETQAAAKKVAGLGVVQKALELAAAEMEQAAAGLSQRETGRSTQRHAAAALARLKMVLAALAGEEASSPAEQDAGGDAGGGDPDGGAGNPQPEQPNTIELAELRLLKLMQLDLRERTAQAEAEIAAGDAPDAAQNRYRELAEEQGQLATLTLQLLEESQVNQTNTEVDLPKLEDALEQDNALPELDL